METVNTCFILGYEELSKIHLLIHIKFYENENVFQLFIGFSQHRNFIIASSDTVDFFFAILQTY